MLTKHLAWHFTRNNVTTERASPWLPSRDDWLTCTIAQQVVILGSEGVPEVIKIEQAPCDINQLDCPLCGEQFDIVSQG